MGNGTYGNIVDLHDIYVKMDDKEELTPEEHQKVLKDLKDGCYIEIEKTFKQHVIDEFKKNCIWHHIRLRKRGKVQLFARMAMITILTIFYNIFFSHFGWSSIITTVMFFYVAILGINFLERNPGYKIIRNYIPENSKIKSITCGSFHSFVLFENGNLWGWGSNERGQLGRVPIGCVLRPTLLFRGVIMVTARDKYSLVLCDEEIKEENETVKKRVLYTMGDNTFGQLANFTKEQTKQDRVEIVPLKHDCDYISIGTMNGMGFAKRPDGDIYAWGLYLIEDQPEKKRKVAKIIPQPTLTRCKSFNELVERQTKRFTYHLVDVTDTSSCLTSDDIECEGFAIIEEKDLITVHYTYGDEEDEKDTPPNVIKINIGDKNKFSLIDDCNIIGDVDIKDVNQVFKKDPNDKDNQLGVLKKLMESIFSKDKKPV